MLARERVSASHIRPVTQCSPDVRHAMQMPLGCYGTVLYLAVLHCILNAVMLREAYVCFRTRAVACGRGMLFPEARRCTLGRSTVLYTELPHGPWLRANCTVGDLRYCTILCYPVLCCAVLCSAVQPFVPKVAVARTVAIVLYSTLVPASSQVLRLGPGNAHPRVPGSRRLPHDWRVAAYSWHLGAKHRGALLPRPKPHRRPRPVSAPVGHASGDMATHDSHHWRGAPDARAGPRRCHQERRRSGQPTDGGPMDPAGPSQPASAAIAWRSVNVEAGEVLQVFRPRAQDLKGRCCIALCCAVRCCSRLSAKSLQRCCHGTQPDPSSTPLDQPTLAVFCCALTFISPLPRHRSCPHVLNLMSPPISPPTVRHLAPAILFPLYLASLPSRSQLHFTHPRSWCSRPIRISSCHPIHPATFAASIRRAARAELTTALYCIQTSSA